MMNNTVSVDFSISRISFRVTAPQESRTRSRNSISSTSVLMLRIRLLKKSTNFS